MQKPKDYSHERPRNKHRSEWLKILEAESLVLEFLHKDTLDNETIRPTTQITMNEFWKYLEEKKQQLDEKFEE